MTGHLAYENRVQTERAERAEAELEEERKNHRVTARALQMANERADRWQKRCEEAAAELTALKENHGDS